MLAASTPAARTVDEPAETLRPGSGEPGAIGDGSATIGRA